MTKLQRKGLTLVLVLALAICAAGVASAADWDLGGRTIRINNRNMNITPFLPRGEGNWGDPDGRLQAHIESVEEMFNVKIEFVTIPGGERMQAIASGILAGDAPADVFIGLNQDQIDVNTLAAQGLLHPVDEYIDSAWIDGMPAMYRAQAVALPLQGRTYGFTGEFFYQTEQMVVAFNKEIIEQEGLPNPYDLYFSGDWTWDAFREIAYAATQDTTGDGEIDRWGASAWQINDTGWAVGIGIVDWAMSNGGVLARIVDGRLEYTFHEDPVVEAIDFWKELFADNVARRGYIGQNGDVALVVTAVHTLAYDNMRDLPFDWGIVPLPKGPNADEHTAPRGIGMGAGSAIPVSEEQPEAVLEVVKSLMLLTAPYNNREEQENRFYGQLEGIVYDRESYEVLQWVVVNAAPWNTDFQLVYGSSPYREAMAAAWDPDANTGAVLAETRPAIQAVIDELLGQ